MIEVEITCTDRNGRRLATRTVRGVDYPATLADRVRISEELMRLHTDHRGVTPYVFRSIKSLDA